MKYLLFKSFVNRLNLHKITTLKRILLLSDTHGHIDAEVVSYVYQADETWHAGDIGNIQVLNVLEEKKPLRAVYGNIDGNNVKVKTEQMLSFNCEGVKVVMTHIAGYPEKYNHNAKNLIQKYQPHLFVCGHSHILKVLYDKKYGHLHMNPGAVGISGFHKKRTMLRFEIECGKIKNLEAIDLGLKSSLSNTIN